jgi:hypothetical protein
MVNLRGRIHLLSLAAARKSSCVFIPSSSGVPVIRRLLQCDHSVKRRQPEKVMAQKSRLAFSRKMNTFPVSLEK